MRRVDAKGIEAPDLRTDPALVLSAASGRIGHLSAMPAAIALTILDLYTLRNLSKFAKEYSIHSDGLDGNEFRSPGKGERVV